MRQDSLRTKSAIVVLGLFMLCAMVVWSFVLPRLGGSRKAKIPQVVANLRQIDVLKQMWSTEHLLTNGTVVMEQELIASYPVPGRTGLVTSVDGETYKLNAIGVPPEAQLQKDWGGRFPKLTIIQLATSGRYKIILPNQHRGANGAQPSSSDTNATSSAAAPGQ